LSALHLEQTAAVVHVLPDLIRQRMHMQSSASAKCDAVLVTPHLAQILLMEHLIWCTVDDPVADQDEDHRDRQHGKNIGDVTLIPTEPCYEQFKNDGRQTCPTKPEVP